MKTLLFILLGIVGIVLLSVGHKKNILIVKLFGIILTVIFFILLLSIVL
ncbi:MAG: hypothetical protein K0R54_6005 [Clostridiaceae bacterium]|jgi:hypothetical protein|nr:hypothetical protein [Clostridiaceae bacterium]